MNAEQAKKALGLEATASNKEALKELDKKRAQVEEKLSSAPTDALREKFQQMQTKLDEVEAVLKSETASSNSHSPLTETKMADLPGMSPSGSQGDAASFQQLNLNPGDTLAGRYQIKEQIGAGGMGAVYRAADSNTGKDIALKVLLPSLMQHEAARERFLDEARISQQLSHPNIVNVFDVQQAGNYFFLTMELLQGQDLRQVMENRKLARSNFGIDEVQEIIKAVSNGLAYAHKYTVHRDIKPENIWLTEEGEYKLMDFGIARVQSTSQRTQTGAAMGTAYYMAPEQLKGAKDIDGRADQYALAVLAYELLSGEVPAGMIEPIQQHRKDTPKAMASAIHQALSPRPENRFDDINGFNAAIQAKSSGVSLPALPVKTIGIAASVVMTIGLIVAVVMSGGMNNFSEFLPKSAEEIAAQKAQVAKQMGEIKTYKQRLENGRRQLNSDLRDAMRNNDPEEKALERWQTLTENYIFNSRAITYLEGELSKGDTLLREDSFEQASVTLTAVRDGYKILWDGFNAAKDIDERKQDASSARDLWLDRKRNYGFDDLPESVNAEKAYLEADEAFSEGDFSEAATKLTQAATGYKYSFSSYNEQAISIDAQRAEEQKRIARERASERKRKVKQNRIAAAKEKFKSINSLSLLKRFLKRNPEPVFKQMASGKKYYAVVSVERTWMENDRLISTHESTFKYNRYGDKIESCDNGKCHSQDKIYNKNGALVKEKYKIGETKYIYNSDGFLVKKETLYKDGKTHTDEYKYDGMQRLVSENDFGAWEYKYNKDGSYVGTKKGWGETGWFTKYGLITRTEKKNASYDYSYDEYGNETYLRIDSVEKGKKFETIFKSNYNYKQIRIDFGV